MNFSIDGPFDGAMVVLWVRRFLVLSAPVPVMTSLTKRLLWAGRRDPGRRFWGQDVSRMIDEREGMSLWEMFQVSSHSPQFLWRYDGRFGKIGALGGWSVAVRRILGRYRHWHRTVLDVVSWEGEKLVSNPS